VASRRDERVFLVRMWLERSTSQRDSWRGSIQDVVSGRKFYVTGPGEIADFIAVRLDEDGPPVDVP
jgi:hypothetical protein